MISAEVAIYPLKTSHATNVIDNSIRTLKDSTVSYTVNSMNTHLTGTKAEIFGSLEAMFTEAENVGGEVSMVVTITNASK
ncbi:MAG: YkoF family thiamine/hydroxymethylpyrimidine-binding protein [Bacillota bacterium]